MFFDAVIDSNLNVIFNGTGEQVRRWLEENETDENTFVCVGQGLGSYSVDDYLGRK